jgi:hypothetical protein
MLYHTFRLNCAWLLETDSSSMGYIPPRGPSRLDPTQIWLSYGPTPYALLVPILIFCAKQWHPDREFSPFRLTNSMLHHNVDCKFSTPNILVLYYLDIHSQIDPMKGWSLSTGRDTPSCEARWYGLMVKCKESQEMGST